MGNFQKGGNRGGFRDRGGRSDFKKKNWSNDRGGDRDRGSITMHRATCADCGRGCEVPFRPTGDKPVFCNDCFGGKRDGDRGGRSDFNDRAPRRDFADRSNFSKQTQSTDDLKKQLIEVNTKVDKLINLFEKFINTKGEIALSKGDPVIVVKEESKKIPSLKTVIKKAVGEKTSSKKVVAKKKK